MKIFVEWKNLRNVQWKWERLNRRRKLFGIDGNVKWEENWTLDRNEYIYKGEDWLLSTNYNSHI